MKLADPILLGFRSAVVLLVAVLNAAIATPAEPPLADFADVEAIVTTHLNHKRGYQPGDLLSQADWDPIATSLTQAGWTPRDAATIRKSLLPAKDFLVLEARSNDGRKFMRQVARYPGGYDRLDRLARMPYGVNNIHQLIRGPDGYKMLEYMSTTAGGSSLGQMLSQDPGGKNFNQATGRIYTAAQLTERLQRSHTADFQRPPAKVR